MSQAPGVGQALAITKKRLLVLLLAGGAAGYLIKTFRPRHRGQRGQPEGRQPRQNFWKTFKRILPIIFPNYASKESVYLGILAVLLISRTGLSIVLAEILGRGAELLVSKQWNEALNEIKYFLALALPASFVNSGLHYYTTMLSLAMRVRLSRHVHDRYLQNVTFYNICNLKRDGEEQIDNVDQRIAVDIKKFSDELSELFTSTFKPTLDIVLFTFTLAKITSWVGPAILYGYFAFTAFVKRFIMPSLGRLAREESRLDGDYRAAHQRLITNSEEVAFYDGSSREKHIINAKLDEVERHSIQFARARAFVSVADNLLVKYWATIAGYLVQFAPVWVGMAGEKSTADMTRDYARLNRYISLLAEAIGNLVLLGNKISELSGHTARVGGLLSRIETVQASTQAFVQADEPIREYVSEPNKEFIQAWKQRMDQVDGALARPPAVDILVDNVRIRQGEKIRFSHVDIISPEGKLLVKDLNFVCRAGENVMITGPNGAGKSSLFRILGDLWPPGGPEGAYLIKPHKHDILFVPQKPYMVLGSLRDQIIYPHSKGEMIARGVTDEDLSDLLRIVDPAGTIRRNWPNWDVVNDWFHTFSGGQKQRVAMARLFYHRPKFAILDECTSAVSDEVEDQIYQTCRQMGITLFTVSHRKYLRKHHEYELVIVGMKGQYQWKKLIHGTDEAGLPRTHSKKENLADLIDDEKF